MQRYNIRAPGVPGTMSVSGGEMRLPHINERSETTQCVVLLGRFKLPAGKLASVTLSNQDTDGFVVADGVQFLPVK